ncbi:MAG: response regulator, partial [Nitrospiraceae bacterium]|nr:response regulator [Nitrospiraceae bacterium]
MGLLIIDDSVDARRLLQCLLRTAGNKDVLTAASMKEAFAHLAQSSRSDRPRIDLILLDIDMPEIDGIEACRRLKADHRLYDTPIIMVTAYKKDRLLAEAFTAGAIDYISKPFARVELLARVRSALTLN